MKKPKVEIYKLNGILNRDFPLYSNSKYIVKEAKIYEERNSYI